jgi:hypothetical protein
MTSFEGTPYPTAEYVVKTASADLDRRIYF